MPVRGSVFGPTRRRLTTRRLLLATLGFAALVLTPGAAAGDPAANLLTKYQPVTVFHPREAFRPTTVESFVADANLEAATGPGTWVLVDPAPTPAKLPKTAVPVRRLNQRACFAGSGPAALQCYVNASADNTRSIVYGRVVKERDATVIQYWYFYYHNLYTYPFRTPGLPPGALWQAHEGDWELVNVVLGRTGQPSYVAYSQHCTGERRPWSKTRRRGGSHPVVYVALGSHAHYRSAGVHSIPRTCFPSQILDLFRQAGLRLPADVTGNGVVAGPRGTGSAATSIRRISSTSPAWIAFPGFWGEAQYFNSPLTGTVPFGTSPRGPAFRPVWRAPLATLARWRRG